MDPAADPRVSEIRDRIAELDDAIVRAVNRRLELVAELRTHKETVGLDFVDHAQEQRLLDRLAQANAGPLSEDGLRELVTEVLALTKRELSRRT